MTLFVNNGAGVRVVAVNNKFGNSNSSAIDVFCGIDVFLSSRRIERYIYCGGRKCITWLGGFRLFYRVFLPRLAIHTATGKASRVYSISLWLYSLARVRYRVRAWVRWGFQTCTV